MADMAHMMVAPAFDGCAGPFAKNAEKVVLTGPLFLHNSHDRAVLRSENSPTYPQKRAATLLLHMLDVAK